MQTNFDLNSRGIREYKNTFYAVSLIALLAVSMAMVFAPSALAQVGIAQPRQTAGHIDVAPHLIGVGQQATVNLWVNPWAEDYGMVAWYGGPNNGTYTGITVTFTRPDGTKDTFTPTDAINVYPAGVLDGLSSMFFYYAPNMAGNWSVTMSMPAQNMTDSTGTVQWMACTSPPAYFTVTTEPQNAGLLNGWPWSPLPNDNTYWTYPISSNNREWSAIAGNWLGVVNGFSNYQPYGSAPNTGHILWEMPYAPGGIVSGLTGTMSYQPSSVSNIIIGGNVYINEGSNFQCISLTTGEVLWTAAGSITGAINLPGNAYIQAASGGGTTTLQGSYGSQLLPNLFQSSGKIWNYYSISTGALSRSITNVSASGFKLIEGTELAYGYTTGTPSYMWKWNMTKVTNNDWYTGLVWKQNYTLRAITAGYWALSADTSTMVFANSRGWNVASATAQRMVTLFGTILGRTQTRV